MCDVCLKRFGRVRQPVITAKRFSNLVHSFPWAKWIETSVEITAPGVLRDKPRWKIVGQYKRMPIVWESAGPSGSAPRMLFHPDGFAGNRLLLFPNATFSRSGQIRKFADILLL